MNLEILVNTFFIEYFWSAYYALAITWCPACNSEQMRLCLNAYSLLFRKPHALFLFKLQIC